MSASTRNSGPAINLQDAKARIRLAIQQLNEAQAGLSKDSFNTSTGLLFAIGTSVMPYRDFLKISGDAD